MRRALEAGAFAGLAAALHGALFLAWTPAGASSGGAGGEALVTLAAASPELRALAQDWSRPPQAQPPAEAPELPAEANADLPELAPVADGVSLPDAPRRAEAPGPRDAPLPAMEAPPKPPEPEAEPRPEPGPEPEAATSPDLAPPPPPRKTAPPRPEPKAEREPRPQPEPQPHPAPKAAETARRDSQARPGAAEAQKAAGAGGAAEAGRSERRARSTGEPGASVDLVRAWGAEVRREVERRKRAPRTLRGGGETALSLTVAPDGTLSSVRIRDGSGDSRLDEAALRAVRDAAPFPAASPDGLGRAQTFILTLRFR